MILTELSAVPHTGKGSMAGAPGVGTLLEQLLLSLFSRGAKGVCEVQRAGAAQLRPARP